jgi:hypothetical protein
MAECSDENETQHYLGVGYGFGAVNNSEFVLFAVFELTHRDGTRVTPDSFDNKQLKKDGLSVCRLSYTSRDVFDEHVVRNGTNPKGLLVGVAAANVENIRKIKSKVVYNNGSDEVRAFCVLDHVLANDFDSHATINYGERTSSGGLSETQINKIRSKARLDLADTFAAISDVNAVFPGADT